MIRHLLTKSVEHLAFVAGAVDELGNPVVSWEAPVAIDAYIYKLELAHDEVVRDREVALSTWRLVTDPDRSIGFRDRFRADGLTFEVDGSPHRVWNPRTASDHHVETQLRLVENGGEGS